MLRPELDLQNKSIGTLCRQPKDDETADAALAQTRLARQHDPTAQLTCRVGDAACAGAHAEQLNRTTLQLAPDTLRRLQRQYGNRFVQRVVNRGRQGEAETGVAPEVEQAIHSARGGGQALDHGVRAQMEPAFRADFSRVRVHTGNQADTLNRALRARAFTTSQDIFFKQGEYNPGSAGGRELLAHELTHVVQQQGGQVQTKLTLGQPGDKYEQEADQVARAIMQREQCATLPPSDQKRVSRQAQEEKEKDQPTPTLVTPGGMQRQADDEETQTKPDDDILQPLTNDAEKDKDKVQSKAAFSLQRQAEADEEEAHTKPNAPMIERQTDEPEAEQGVVQGKLVDNATQRPSEDEEQSAQTMLESGSISRQSAEEEPLQTNVEQRAVQRQDDEEQTEGGAIQSKAAGGFVQPQTEEKKKEEPIQRMAGDRQFLPQVAHASNDPNLEPFPIQRQAEPAKPEAREQSATTDTTAPKQNLSWFERGAVWAFEKALGAAGIDQKQMMGLVNRAGSAFMEIIQHPGRFLSAIIKAIGQGFTQFKDNIGQHLMSGLLAWLLGAMVKAGIQLPKDFSLKSIVGLVLQVLGITAEQIKQRLAKVIGEKNVRRIEKAWEFISTFIREGIGGLWNLLKEYLGNLKEMVLAEVKSWLIVEIVKAGVLKVVAMFNPVTGLIAIVKTIYNVIKFLVERARQIAALFQAIAGSVVALALGNFKAAADKIELALARLIPIVIGFLASLLGISGIGEKVKTIIKKIQAPVEKAIDKVIGGIAKGLKKLGGAAFSKIKSGADWTKAKVKQAKEWAKGKAQQVTAWFKRKFESTFEAKGERHRMWIEMPGNKPRIMVASNEQSLNSLLQSLETQAKAQPELLKKIAQLRSEISQIEISYTKLMKLTQAALSSKANKKAGQIVTDQKRIAQLLANILTELRLTEGDAPTGEANDPIPIIWWKDFNQYPTIEFQAAKGGPKHLMPSSGEKEKIHAFDQEYTLGVSDTFIPKAGQPPLQKLKGTRGGRDRKMKKALQSLSDLKVGKMGPEGNWSVDHVKDIAWNGPDIDENLWPLDGERNVKGNAVHNQYVIYKDTDGTTNVSQVQRLTGKYFSIAAIIDADVLSSSSDHGTTKNLPVNNGKVPIHGLVVARKVK